MASFALAGSLLYKLVGVALLVMAVGLSLTFLQGQRKVAAALSRWFEVKITAGQLPVMNPDRFDAWSKKRGLSHKDVHL